MGLFGKKEDSRKEYNQALDNLNSTETVRDRVHFQQVFDNDDPVKIADILISGQPLVLDFGELNIDEANKDLAFLAGVTYALKGEVIHIIESIYLFARSTDFSDGSLDEMIREI